MSGLNTSLITQAARAAVEAEIANLGLDLTLHDSQGLDQHNNHTILDIPYVDNAGNVVASKTLRIGVKLSNGTLAYVKIPAILSE